MGRGPGRRRRHGSPGPSAVSRGSRSRSARRPIQLRHRWQVADAAGVVSRRRAVIGCCSNRSRCRSSSTGSTTRRSPGGCGETCPAAGSSSQDHGGFDPAQVSPWRCRWMRRGLASADALLVATPQPAPLFAESGTAPARMRIRDVMEASIALRAPARGGPPGQLSSSSSAGSTPNKDPLTVLGGFHRFVRNHPDATLTFVYEDDELEPELRAALGADPVLARRVSLSSAAFATRRWLRSTRGAIFRDREPSRSDGLRPRRSHGVRSRPRVDRTFLVSLADRRGTGRCAVERGRRGFAVRRALSVATPISNLSAWRCGRGSIAACRGGDRPSRSADLRRVLADVIEGPANALAQFLGRERLLQQVDALVHPRKRLPCSRSRR